VHLPHDCWEQRADLILVLILYQILLGDENVTKSLSRHKWWFFCRIQITFFIVLVCEILLAPQGFQKTAVKISVNERAIPTIVLKVRVERVLSINFNGPRCYLW